MWTDQTQFVLFYVSFMSRYNNNRKALKNDSRNSMADSHNYIVNNKKKKNVNWFWDFLKRKLKAKPPFPQTDIDTDNEVVLIEIIIVEEQERPLIQIFPPLISIDPFHPMGFSKRVKAVCLNQLD